MFESVRQLRKTLAGLVAGLDPAVCTTADAATLVEEFAAIERLCGAGRLLAAGRAAHGDVWKTTGHRSPADWLARTTGASVGHATGDLETARRLDTLPATTDALRSGALSATQVRDIASAAADNPAAETELLATAEREGVAGLRSACQRVRANSADHETRARRLHARRYLRHWTNPEGAVCLDARLAPDAAAGLLAALEPFREQVFAHARTQGRRESYDAYSADALVAMAHAATTGDPAAGGSSGGSGRVKTIVHIDHRAFLRGDVGDGETCEVVGVGPVPVSVARALSVDAFLAAVVTDGVDVRAVAHLGRTIPAHVRTALEVRDRECVVPGCHTVDRLEIDHVHPFTHGGPTRLENLARLCRFHHDQKTYRGFVLRGGPGTWEWLHPRRARAVTGDDEDPVGVAPTLAFDTG